MNQMNFNFEIIFRAILIGWWLINFGPTRKVLDKIKTKVPPKFTYIRIALTCHVCQSFWYTLLGGAIFKHDFLIWDAILAAIIAFTYERIINSLKQYF